MATILDLQDRGLRYGVIVDAAATTATLAAIERAGLRYKVEVASGITAADRAALDRRGLQYFVPVAATVSMADRAILERQGLRYAVQVDATVLPADLAILERQGLSYFVEVDSSGNAIATAAGGAILLVDETNGFATDFTHPVDAERVAVKTAGTVVSSGLSFYTNAGTSPKMVYDVAGTLVWSPHNLFPNSKNASLAVDRANTVITADVTAGPLGDITADQIAFGGANNSYHYQSTIGTSIVGAAYCGAVWLKAASPTTIGIRLFNTTTGTQAVSVVSVTTAWQQFSAFFTNDNAGAVGFGLDNRTFVSGADGLAKTVIAADWQINRGTVPTAYLPTTTAARNGLAIDYDPVTHASRGLLCEPAGTNLILNNATMSTQSVTVTAVAHTLSFWGTGTVTLTGVSTAGPLVGTGASNRVSLTFTPTAGSLTCTVSGTVSRAQLEIGSVATSSIPTFAATATRAVDQYSITSASINYSATAGSWWADLDNMPTGAGPRVIGYSAGAATPIYISGLTFAIFGDASNLGKSVAAVLGVHKVACAFQSGDRAITADGLAAATDAGVTTSLLAPGTTVSFGSTVGGGNLNNGYIRKITYRPRRVANASLVTETA